MDAETMNLCLQKFVIEVRKQDGQEYPPRSLYYIICGLLRFLRDRDIYDKNFLDENDSRFAVLRKVLDAKMKELLSRDIGTKVKQADPILPEDEEKIWEAQVFGMHSAQSLQYTVFFYNCKLFGLRAFDEHRSFECEQFEIGSDNHRKYVHFIGRRNKTFKGGIKQMQLQNKDIKHYCTDGTRCIADYYEKYLTALGNRGYFYRRPLAGGIVRYGEQVVGVNKIKGLMKEITTKTGLQGNYTNHSGKRTCATQLYIAGIPEQEITARTGHRTETAVRKYKRSSSKIHEEVSQVLNPPSKVVKSENNSESEPMEACSSVITDKKVPLSALKDITNLEKSVFNNCVFNF